MRWLLVFMLLLAPHYALAELSLTIDPVSGPVGTSVTLFADWSGTQTGDLSIYGPSGPIGLPKSCSGSCTLSVTHDISSSTPSFYAELNVEGTNPVSNTVFFDVLDNVGPSVALSIPESGSISQELVFDIQVSDDAVSLVKIDFNDSSFDEQTDVGSCSDSPCEVTFYHTYEKTGEYVVSVTATDSEGASTTEEHVINIDSSLDTDADGVLDEVDVCVGTAPEYNDNVATSGEFKGCACGEVNEFSFGDDGDACTRTECSISSGEMSIDHVSIPDGGQPEGYSDSGTTDYYCEGGQVESTGSCEPEVATHCWGDVGSQDVYFYNSCGDRGARAESCSSSEVCVDDPDGAFCTTGDACLSSPGCRVSQPSNTEHADGVCDTGRTCYSCQDGWHWNGLKCVESLDCSPLYFNDHDGDGQGAGTGQCSEQFPNPVTNSLDCNDNNEDAYVGAIEICDGVDNDCDGEIDEDCVGEAYPECQKDPEIDFIWKVDTNNACQEREFRETTTFTPTSEQCDYTENDPTITATGNIRNKADGTSCESGFCNDGQCVPSCEHHCLAEKPDNSIEVTAQSCSGDNSCFKCANNMIWDGDKCVNTGYQIVNVNSMTIEDQKTYTIDPILQTDEGDEKEAVFTYKGLINRKTTSPLTLLADGIGKKTLTITASRLQGTQEIQAATTTIEITTVCSSESQCCIEGTTDPAPDGSECTGGTCEGGECQVTCEPSFENSPRTCSDGIDNSCNGIIDCQEINGEVNEGCRPFCEAFCEQGEAACGNQCYDLETSHNNCGVCGNSCSDSEICQGGQCIDQGDECFVACSDDDECDGTCQLAGTCEAFCEDTGVLELQEEDQTALLSDVIRQRTFAINKTIINEELTITATNLVGGTLHNFTMLISFPQEFQFTNSNYPYEQLNERTIRVRTNLEGRQRFEYDLTSTGDPERIIIETTHDSVDPTTAKKLSNDELTIRSNFEETEDSTRVSLKLTPGGNLKDLRVPLEIPKCLAEHVDEIQFDQSNYEVINVDPLMVWTFDALNAEQEITFTVPKVVDQNCKDQMRAFGVADSEPINPWLPIAIIPIIGLVLVFFQRFHKDTQHLSKKEFYKLAKEQGQSEGDIERSWAEYKRRF